MTKFEEVSAEARTYAQSGGYTDAVAAALLLASDAREPKSPMMRERATLPQIGYVSVLARFGFHEFQTWKCVASHLELSKAHVGNAINALKAGDLDSAIARLTYRPEYEPPEPDITYDFSCFAFDGAYLTPTAPPDAFDDCDCDLRLGEHMCTVHDHVERNERMSIDVLLDISGSSGGYVVFRDVDGDASDPVWVGEWSGGNNGDSSWPGILYYTQPCDLPALLDALITGIKLPLVEQVK